MFNHLYSLSFPNLYFVKTCLLYVESLFFAHFEWETRITATAPHMLQLWYVFYKYTAWIIWNVPLKARRNFKPSLNIGILVFNQNIYKFRILYRSKKHTDICFLSFFCSFCFKKISLWGQEQYNIQAITLQTKSGAVKFSVLPTAIIYPRGVHNTLRGHILLSAL